MLNNIRLLCVFLVGTLLYVSRLRSFQWFILFEEEGYFIPIVTKGPCPRIVVCVLWPLLSTSRLGTTDFRNDPEYIRTN